MKITLNNQREQPFTVSALPLTMELAKLTRSIVIPHLTELPENWPYEDKVLTWLDPAFYEEVCNFHTGEGNELSQILESHQVEHLDITYLSKLLSKLEELRPGITEIVA